MSIPDETSPAGLRPVPQNNVHARRMLSVLGLIFVALLLAVLGGAAYAGFQAGATQRGESLRATQAADLQTQFDLGLADLASKRYVAAATRFQYILDIEADYPGAAAKLAEVQALLNVTPTPVPYPAPTTPPDSGDDPAKIYALIERRSNEGQWDAVISAATRLFTVDPAYKPVETAGLLFKALRNRGVARIQGDEMEAGIADLDQAAKFSLLDDEAKSHRAWARLYLAAKSYWEVNWAETVVILNQLYLLAPNFKGTTSLLRQATVKYAEQLAAAGQACEAAGQYTAAQQLAPDEATAAALTAAQTDCQLTPTAETTPAVTLTPSP